MDPTSNLYREKPRGVGKTKGCFEALFTKKLQPSISICLGQYVNAQEPYGLVLAERLLKEQRFMHALKCFADLEPI